MFDLIADLAFGHPVSGESFELSVLLLAGLVGLTVSGAITLAHELRIERAHKRKSRSVH